MGVGYLFRVRVSDMPEFPGQSLYPSIEVIDRLHPPRGKVDKFPIPVELSADEIRLALSGRMITKVVYLEQPQLAIPRRDRCRRQPYSPGATCSPKPIAADARWPSCGWAAGNRPAMTTGVSSDAADRWTFQMTGGVMKAESGKRKAGDGECRMANVECRKNDEAQMTKAYCFALVSLLAIGLCSCQSSIPNTNALLSDDRAEWLRPDDHEAKPDQTSGVAGVAHASHVMPDARPMRRQMPVVMQTAAYQPSEPQGNPAHLYPDEYLFDGGDRAKPIHYDTFRRLGLDTEDTIAEYTDHTGKRKVKPSNRVAVYSPRFAAVRTIDQPEQGIGGNRATSMLIGDKLGGVDGRLAPTNHKGRFVPNGVRVRERGSSLDTDRKDATAQGTVAVASHGLNTRALENLAIIRSGKFDRTQEAVLAMGIQAAAKWTRRQRPMITATNQIQGEVSARFNPSEYVGREDMRKTTGKLRIVKVADKQTAEPGEVITFTIRYDNLGDRELHHIRILDNLTPRLEYVKDSADSDRAGRLVVEENQEGSLVLKFELADPLPGHKGGVVKFQAKVR